ncbi:MAG: response regulator [Myxococcales bacterium]|nr:response regulator [Myxococcales bacterium]
MSSRTEIRILLVDDNPAIHEDFRKILAPADPTSASLDEIEALLFDAPTPTAAETASYELVSATQGEEALRLVEAANAVDRPFALAFVDMRMPPGWDGVETIERIWRVDPRIQIVICSAHSDCSWSEVRARVGTSDSLLILKKPFDTIEVVQCAHALATKWTLARRLRAQIDELETSVASRTHELQQANTLLAEQMQERARMEVGLRLAQKLEAVGQLAAGIAHEINTPIQYVGDNLSFLQDSVGELVAMGTAMLAAASSARTEATAPLVGQLEGLAASADLTYLATAIPESLESLTGGVARIAKIVRAMKELAHPGPREATAVDLTRALGNALEVTAGAYRMVADVVTEFAATPPVVCFGSELNQVFLNLIVNAAQAMEDRPGKRGTLRIATRVDGGDVIVEVSDTGAGIPESHRERIFDAFFTTKEVGRGTGQGLAISRSIVVDRHGGSLTFESTVGVGTTFQIRIPIAGPTRRAQAAAA